MPPLPRIDGFASRCAAYIAEFREFFANRGLSCGDPSQLQPFLERLGSDTPFQEETISLLRSVVYRENENVSQGELADLLAVAVAGPGALQDNAHVSADLRELALFIATIVRSQRNLIPAEEGTADVLPSDAVIEDHAAPILATPLPLTGAEVDSGQHDHDSAHRTTLDLEIAAAQTNDRLSRALSDMAAEATQDESSPGGGEQPRVQLPKSASAARPASNPGFRAALNRSYWIPGVCVLLLAIGAVLALARKPGAAAPAQSAPVLAETQPDPAAGPDVVAAQPIQGRRNLVKRRASESAVASATAFPAKPSPARVATPAAGPTSPPLKSSGSAPAPKPSPSVARNASPARAGLDPREGVFLASSGAMAAHLLFAPAPGYPKLASFTHVEGQVILQVVVARDGAVAATRVLEGPHLLRGAAEHAVRRWRYRPYLVDGRPTDVATLVTVTFRLNH